MLYEMHIGNFTQEGTWEATQRELQELASIGVNALEIMPIAEFPGAFGWGYDGVDLFAPYHYYGSPRDLRSFVDEAHASGIAIILDVVYNHLGPDGNYLIKYSEDYFTDRYWTEWGSPFNPDGENSGPVREFILVNASYWIDEYYMDGLRLHATQNIYDSSPDHIFSGIGGAVRTAAGGRTTVVIGENEPQDTRLIRLESQGGCGLNVLWNDDFHHSAMVSALTGHNEAYYTDYLGNPQEFISAVKWGYLYQGENVQMAEETPWKSLPGFEAPDLCDLSTEPRSARQLGPRIKGAPAYKSRKIQGCDCSYVPCPQHTHALSGSHEVFETVQEPGPPPRPRRLFLIPWIESFLSSPSSISRREGRTKPSTIFTRTCLGSGARTRSSDLRERLRGRS